MFKTTSYDKNGNSDDWYCPSCVIKHDAHEDWCSHRKEPLKTRKETVGYLDAITLMFCEKCGCTYSNGCKEHPASVQKSIGGK